MLQLMWQEQHSDSVRKELNWFRSNSVNEMPAYKEEIEATLAEGIVLRNGWGPKQIFGNGSVIGIRT